MKVKDVMTRKVLSIEPTANVLQAVRLMLQNKISGLPVVRLVSISIINDRPEPLAPPSGSGMLAACPSVVGWPCASSVRPGRGFL